MPTIRVVYTHPINSIYTHHTYPITMHIHPYTHIHTHPPSASHHGRYPRRANVNGRVAVWGIRVVHTYTHTRTHTHTNTHVHTHSDTGTAVLGADYPPIPWVFTKEQIALVNSRCKRLILPPGCAAFCTTKAGIFEDTSSFWRMSSKLQFFLVFLPVLFMGTVPSLYDPLLKLAHGVLLLLGRVVSERFRRLKGCVSVCVCVSVSVPVHVHVSTSAPVPHPSLFHP